MGGISSTFVPRLTKGRAPFISAPWTPSRNNRVPSLWLASNSQPVYTPSADPSTGYLLFMREGTLMAQPFDNRRLELKGQAVPVAEQVRLASLAPFRSLFGFGQ